MSNENLNLITVIKYLQDQYTLNERNRLNYELLLRSKQLQKEKSASVDNINQTLKQIRVDSNKFSEQSEIDNIIQETKFKLSTAMKDLDMILAEQDFNSDLTYKKEVKAPNFTDEADEEKSLFIPSNFYTSNIPNVNKVILNGNNLFLIDFDNGFIEKRTIDSNKKKILLEDQKEDEFLKNASNCWYNNKSDNFVCTRDDSLYELEKRNVVDVSRKDRFYKFEDLCDCKYTNFAYIDNEESIKVINVNTSAKYVVDLEKHGIGRVLDLKFGVTETSVLVMTDKSFLIIDYVNDVVLKDTNTEFTVSSPIKYGKITVSNDLSYVVLSHILHNQIIMNSIYSLENFNLIDCAHKVYGVNDLCMNIVASNDRIFYKFDKQIQIRRKDGAFIGSIILEDGILFSDIVVDNRNHLHHIYKKSKHEKMTIEEYVL